MDLSNQTFFRQDFSGQDLQGVAMHHSTFTCCNFDNANMNGNNCQFSNFKGSTLVDTKCHNTDFAHAKLDCVFKPADAYGMTVTLRCATFRGMIISSLWWYCFVHFALLMLPDKDEDGVNPKDALIASLGTRKYLQLKRAFLEREF